MKSIMISIQPQWVEKILKGEKTIEIRKTKPSCDLPVKVYIYETKSKFRKGYYNNLDHKIHYYEDFGKGKVVAEFTLNQVDTIEICDPCVLRNGEQQDWHWFKSNACLDSEEMMSYIGYGDDHDGWGSEYAKGYAWHIDDLKIYDKPKELGEFTTSPYCSNYMKNVEVTVNALGDYVAHYEDNFFCKKCKYFDGDFNICERKPKPLTRPPQSYMFVEELEEV